MGKINTRNTMKTTNKCGAPAYNYSDKEKLATMVLTSFWDEKKFYGDNSTELLALAERTDPAFVGALAIYARNAMNLRSISHVLTAVVAHAHRAELTRPVVAQVIQRPDDLTEIMQFYLTRYGKPVPNALKRQMGKEMNRFTEYQYAKYDKAKMALSFKDLLSIIHAKPIGLQNKMTFKGIMEGTLETPYTWETQLSERGNTREVWEELIDSGKVGYMALLRNLRNILKANPRNLDKVLAKLSNPNEVRRSHQLPFRFLSAYMMIREENLGSTKVYDALEDAISASCDNLHTLTGKTLIAIDTSCSMRHYISSNSVINCADVGRLMGAMATRICEDADVITFNTSVESVQLSSRNGILSNAMSIPVNGGGTDCSLPFWFASQKHEKYDRIIILSDNMSNCLIHAAWAGDNAQREMQNYRKNYNPDCWVHAIDLVGYGTTQWSGNKVNYLAGWNERVLSYISMVEDGMSSLLKDIESYNPLNIKTPK